MKLFRISKVEEFFNSFPGANEFFVQANNMFLADIGNPMRFINLHIQKRFDGGATEILLELSYIVFRGEYELYYYEIKDNADN